ncbi:NAD kinase [Demequina capsici]|uniref:NAD kinase n=1 Tax=Demequina capsici TaxID=3075620 RepID=A0AA96J8F3_9MICO|nr:NAD kinase [Demequina sp. PMTSA13]WNM26127.1 NAD kinase [Demequina sp. PMTSA13]
MGRRILIVANPHREDTLAAVEVARAALVDAGIDACTDFAAGVDAPIEAALVLGGDGTMLHAAHLTRDAGIPLLGVNLGHVGFLAELERDDVAHAAQRLASGAYEIEERGTVDVKVIAASGDVEVGWALNEATIERANPRTMLEVDLAVDGRPLSSFGCDGIVVATATGSTAHAFSGGGPVLWPNVEGLLLVPLAAHALFARPLVIGPGSTFTIDVVPHSETSGHVVLDGSRTIPLQPGGRVEMAYSAGRVRLARLSDAPFTERLVRKFHLPTTGWREDGRVRAPGVAGEGH